MPAPRPYPDLSVRPGCDPDGMPPSLAAASRADGFHLDPEAGIAEPKAKGAVGARGPHGQYAPAS